MPNKKTNIQYNNNIIQYNNNIIQMYSMTQYLQYNTNIQHIHFYFYFKILLLITSKSNL